MHIAIIPDGNRRWATAKALAPTKGHEHSVQIERIEALLMAAKRLGIQHLSIWAFSTENWNRPEAEKKALFTLLEKKLGALSTIMKNNNIQFRWIGRRDRVPENLRQELEQLEKIPEKVEMSFSICFDYGGRDELLRAINEAVREGKEVTEESFSQLLDTKELPDPDLIIRTSGEQRLSGFMPWQGTYAELYFTEKHFPDFGPEELEEAISAFKKRGRRFGK